MSTEKLIMIKIIFPLNYDSFVTTPQEKQPTKPNQLKWGWQ
jgi:hypothetical protein